MKKRPSLKKCRNLAIELCNKSPKLINQNFWFYFPNEELIWIGNDSLMKEEEKAITLQYFQKLTNSNFSLFTYSFLHELGHYNSYNIEYATGKEIQDNNDYYFIVTKALTDGLISFERAIELYYQEDSELEANNFLIQTIENYYDLISNFDNNL